MTISTVPPTTVAPDDWTTIISTSAIDAERLVSELGVPHEFYVHALDQHELPRMETSGGATLIVLRVPWSEGERAKEPWTTRPFGLVLLEGKIVAIARDAHPVLDQIAGFAQRDAHRQPRLVLHALKLVAEAYLKELIVINETVDRLEDALRASLENREVLELLKCQRGFVYFATALRSTELLLERLQRSQLLHAAAEDAELLEDVRVEIRQALDMTQTSADILGEMMDAFASIISNNLSVVMKFLAAVTVVLMIPTLIASFYGMNVALPLAANPSAFVFAVIGSFVLSAVVAGFFIARRWL